MTDAPLSAPSIRLVRRTPSVQEDLRLREAAGPSPCPGERAGRGLPVRSTAKGRAFRGRPVGRGRIVGDGRLLARVADIAVEPGFQGRGLGQAIMTARMAPARAERPVGLCPSLIADLAADRRPVRRGVAPAAPCCIGMAQRPA